MTNKTIKKKRTEERKEDQKVPLTKNEKRHLAIYSALPKYSKIKAMIKEIMQRSLRWPTLKYFADYGLAKTLHHPKNLNELNESSHEFELWVERFDKIIKGLLQKLEKNEKV